MTIPDHERNDLSGVFHLDPRRNGLTKTPHMTTVNQSSGDNFIDNRYSYMKNHNLAPTTPMSM